MFEEQCDEPMCTTEAVVYRFCVDHAPIVWIESALEELDLSDDQEARLRERLEEEKEAEDASGPVEIPHVDDWEEHYPTTTSRGAQEYPIPEDWVIDIVEGDGIMWDRFEEIGQEYEHDSEVVEARDYNKDAGTPDETASLGRGLRQRAVIGDDGEPKFETVRNPKDHELRINGTVVFGVNNDDVEDGEIWATTAAILSRHARGEPYDDLVTAIEWDDDDQRSVENQSLAEFATSADGGRSR